MCIFLLAALWTCCCCYCCWVNCQIKLSSSLLLLLLFLWGELLLFWERKRRWNWIERWLKLNFFVLALKCAVCLQCIYHNYPISIVVIVFDIVIHISHDDYYELLLSWLLRIIIITLNIVAGIFKKFSHTGLFFVSNENF